MFRRTLNLFQQKSYNLIKIFKSFLFEVGGGGFGTLYTPGKVTVYGFFYGYLMYFTFQYIKLSHLL